MTDAAGLARYIADAGGNRAGQAHATRRLLLVPILLVHAAILAWVATDRMAMPAHPRGAGRLITFDVPPAPQPPAARPRVEPVVKAVIPPPPVIDPLLAPPPPIAAPSITLAQTEEVPLGGGCDLTDAVQAALRGSPDALAAIAAFPARERSVANAVMLWDGRWIEANTAGGRHALAQIRRIVLATIAGASDACRTQLQAGPRLVAIPGPPDTMLALGSGRWHWQDLAPVDATRIAMAPSASDERDGAIAMID